jgi:hypothetical protein
VPRATSPSRSHRSPWCNEWTQSSMGCREPGRSSSGHRRRAGNRVPRFQVPRSTWRGGRLAPDFSGGLSTASDTFGTKHIDLCRTLLVNGAPDPDLPAVGLTGGHLAFQAGTEELLMGPALCSGERRPRAIGRVEPRRRTWRCVRHHRGHLYRQPEPDPGKTFPSSQPRATAGSKVLVVSSGWPG